MNSKLIGSAPVLLVHDVETTAQFYSDKLGFHYHRLWGEPPSFCILHRDAYSVMISKIADNINHNPNDHLDKTMWDIYFWTDNVEVLYEEIIQKGIPVFAPLTVKVYGVKEFEIKDNNGYIIAFGEEMKDI